MADGLKQFNNKIQGSSQGAILSKVLIFIACKNSSFYNKVGIHLGLGILFRKVSRGTTVWVLLKGLFQ